MLALCGSKRTCDETGAPQPAYKQEGYKIQAEFQKPKGEELDEMENPADPIERKQVWFGCVDSLSVLKSVTCISACIALYQCKHGMGSSC